MSEKEKQSVQLKGQLRLYMQLPAVMAVLLAILNIWIYRMDRRAGLLMLIFVIIYIIMVGFLYIYSKSIIMKDLVEFAAQYGIVQNVLLRELAIPYAILLDDGKAVWMNGEFEKGSGRETERGCLYQQVHSGAECEYFPEAGGRHRGDGCLLRG